MPGQEARRRRPSQARPHDCSSTSQDSRRLGREPKTTRRVWIPSLTNGRQPTQSTEAECPPRAATATVGQGVSVYRAGTPAQPAPGDHPLPTWHTRGRSRDDFVSITPQPRATLQFTQMVRRLGRDPESSSGPPVRRSHNQDPPQSTGPAPRQQDANSNGPARPLFKLRKISQPRPKLAGPVDLLHAALSLRLGTKIHSSFAGHIQPLKADKHQNPVHGLSN